METGCVPLNFCAYKAPFSSDYVEYSCRTCSSIDICNSRFLKPQGLGFVTPAIIETSSVSSTSQQVPEISSTAENTQTIGSVTTATATERLLTNQPSTNYSTITEQPLSNNPTSTVATNQQSPHKKPTNSASTPMFSAVICALTTTITVLFRKNYSVY